MNPATKTKLELGFLAARNIDLCGVKGHHHNLHIIFQVDSVAERISGLTNPKQFRSYVKGGTMIEGLRYADGESIIKALRRCNTKPANIFIESYDIAADDIRSKYANQVEDTSIRDAVRYPVIALKPYEKLCDRRFRIMDIEIRGKPSFIDYLFNARDVAECFGVSDLETRIQSKCCEGLDYVFLQVACTESQAKSMYLTSMGLISSIDESECIDYETFATWVTMYAPDVHLSNRIGSSSVVLSQFSSMYVFRIGTAGQLRSLFGLNSTYSDDAVVGLVGVTRDLRLTCAETMFKYGRFDGAQIVIRWMGFIPEKSLDQAETELRVLLVQEDLAYLNGVPGLIICEPDLGIYEEVCSAITQAILKKIDRKRRKVFQARTATEAMFMQDSTNAIGLVKQLEAAMEQD